MPKRRESPSYRFYALYDKVYREDVLDLPGALPRPMAGRPGWTARRFEDIEEYGVERWLEELAEELRKKTYRPQACDGCGSRSRTGETAAGHPDDQGPGGADGGGARAGGRSSRRTCNRSNMPIDRDAARLTRCAVHRLLNTGYREVVDADLSGISTAFRIRN